MTTRVTSNDLFPLLELPDDVLSNILQRCPPGSIAGFPLPLALAQVRLRGSVDPNWLRPLLHAASKCPVVLDRLTPHLRSIKLLATQSTNPLIPVAPYLTRLERLSIDQKVSTAALSALPTGLTKLSVWGVDLEEGSLEDLSASLLRLTALEELDLITFLGDEHWTVGGSLPRLRRLECSGRPPRDLDTFAPNLEALETSPDPQNMKRLPITLTELRFFGDLNPEDSLLPLTRLTGLKDLGFIDDTGIPELLELPELLGALTALTQLKVFSHVTDGDLPRQVKALERGPEGLGLCLHEVYLDFNSPAVKRLFRHLVEVAYLKTNNPASLPWAALTRLTWLALRMDGSDDTSWIQPLSQLPNLRELNVTLESQVPEGFGALTQCTDLCLRHLPLDTVNLSCLQRLTRLRNCIISDSPVECLAALPDCLTTLHVLNMHKSPDLPLGEAIQHLTALEDLTIMYAPGGPKDAGEDRVCDLSPLKRLTRLSLVIMPCPLVLLGSLPCLRSLHVFAYPRLDHSFLRQLENAPSLRELCLDCDVVPEPLTDASLVPLLSLSLLEVLELPKDLGHVTPGAIRRLRDHLPFLDTLIVRGIDGRLLSGPGLGRARAGRELTPAVNVFR